MGSENTRHDCPSLPWRAPCSRPDITCAFHPHQSWKRYLPGFYLQETCFLQKARQILHAKCACAKPHISARLSLCAFEIDNHQAPSWFEDANQFSKSETFEVIRQMVHHQGTQHHIKRVVGEGQLLDHSDLEVDRETGSLGFGTGTRDLPGTRVNAAYVVPCANTLSPGCDAVNWLP